MATAPEDQTHYLQLSGLRIRVRVFNSGKPGLPLLCFNGVGASMELLQPFVDEVRNTTVIIYDVPGTGESDAPGYPWRPRRHARLAVEVLRSLGFSQVNVLGISWGGMLAQEFARQYPDICKGLVLAATSAGQLMVPARPRVLLRMSNPLRYLIPSYMEAIAGDIYGGSLRTDKLQVREHFRHMKPPSIKGYFYQVLSLLGWSSLPWLHTLQQRTLVLAGDDDPIVPLINARMLTAKIPRAKLRVVDCGHLFLLTRASILAPEIEQFLA
ncbi:MAG: poly(3-hydroxyalkanoate) depolymerase [Gammaproteobacteria bacterium]|nr:poly(3-hydroxyalkanoate) depolymerase [Gammaproteobacteria bacterium]